jgi:hypothetical protein
LIGRRCAALPDRQLFELQTKCNSRFCVSIHPRCGFGERRSRWASAKTPPAGFYSNDVSQGRITANRVNAAESAPVPWDTRIDPGKSAIDASWFWRIEMGGAANRTQTARISREEMMRLRSFIGATALTIASLASPAAQAFDESRYPDLKGQWRSTAVPTGLGSSSLQFDPHRPTGRAQQAPLTPEYQAIFEANMAEQSQGGQAGDPTYRCLPSGMPRVMGASLEVVVLPETTYISALTGAGGFHRWIYTDGRDFPDFMADNPQFNGYSIGRWLDHDGDGRYDTLVVETRGMKGPRAFESTGMVLHRDNQTIVKERIYVDRTNANVLHDEITTIDHALTRPWTVTKDYRRAPGDGPMWWIESVCTENNQHVTIGEEAYFLSADGLLMPSKKDQSPPDLRYFRPRR